MSTTATDGDGDSATANRNQAIAFKFEDDGPDVEIGDAPNSVNENQTIAGTWTLDEGSDGVPSVAVTIGAITKLMSISGSGTETVTIGAGDGFTLGTLIVRENLTWEFTANPVASNQSFTFSIKAPTATATSTPTRRRSRSSTSTTRSRSPGPSRAWSRKSTAWLAASRTTTDAGGLDTDENAPNFNNTVTNVASGSFGSLIVGGVDGTLSFQIATFAGNPPVNTVGNGPLMSGGDPVLFHRDRCRHAHRLHQR